MEDFRPRPAIIEKEDGTFLIPNPRCLDLVDLAVFTKRIIEAGDTAVLVDDEGITRTFDFGVLREEPPDRINQLCMTYARAMHNAREVFAFPINS